MDPDFYDSNATAFELKNNILKQYKAVPNRIEQLKATLDGIESSKLEGIKKFLSVVKPIYSNDGIPGYGDFSRIDRVYGLFDCVQQNLSYLSLNNGPGYFDLYMNLKLSGNCSVFAMSQRKYELSKIGMNFDPSLFLVCSGDTATGDLRLEWKSFLRDFHRAFNTVEFAICSLPYNSDVSVIQSFYSNVNVTLQCLEQGRNAILEIPGSGSILEYDLVYACARCFRQISLFKPITSDLFSPRRYLICKDYKPDDELLQILSMDNVLNLNEHSRLFDAISEELIGWLELVNGEIDDIVLKQYENAIDLISGKEIKVPTFNQTLIYAYSQLLK
jgi:hypothetical protein